MKYLYYIYILSEKIISVRQQQRNCQLLPIPCQNGFIYKLNQMTGKQYRRKFILVSLKIWIQR